MQTSSSFPRLLRESATEGVYEVGDSIHGWILPRKSWTGRVDVLASMRLGGEGILRSRGAHHQQSNGAAGRHLWALGAEEPCTVKVVTDSQYIQRAMTRHISKWVTRGWKNSHGVPVSNRDLWETLLRERSRHEVTWTWIRGHGASAEQNRCDELSQAAARRLMVAFLNSLPTLTDSTQTKSQKWR